MHPKLTWQGGAILLGLIAAGLGCFGAYEFGLKLEGGKVSYLVIAAPVVAAAAALIPPLAEDCWRRGMYLKCIFWWFVLAPAAATVFFASAERVHLAKSGAEAERGAYRSAVARANGDLENAKAKFDAADAALNKAKGRGAKGVKLDTAQVTFDTAFKQLEEAKAAVLAAEKKSTSESEYQAPDWLLPAALDLIAFMAIWTGLSSSISPVEPVHKRAKKKQSRSKASPAKPRPRRRKVAEGDNVVPLRAARP